MKIPVLSVKILGDHIFALIKQENMLSLAMINKDLSVKNEIATFNASRGFILDASEGILLLSIDNKLVLIENSSQIIVLKLENSKNFFWHATRAENKMFVQEYEEPPTRIFASEDLKNWKKIAANTDLDRHSKHFHYITYDPYRKWLIATLGDGCLTRVVYSEDFGETWKPLYRGPWQFVPVLVEESRWILGFDSGIARSGVGVYENGKLHFIFLKSQFSFLAQFADLKKIGDVYVAALGLPTAIVISRDLRFWYPLHIDLNARGYNHFVSVDVFGNGVVAATGSKLLFFSRQDIENAFRQEPFLKPYKALFDRVKGFGFILKRLPWFLKL